jgi:hypothetical protein
MAICADTAPGGFDVGAGHVSACWLHASDLSAAQSSPLAHSSPTAPGEAEEETS